MDANNGNSNLTAENAEKNNAGCIVNWRAQYLTDVTQPDKQQF
jgi:hypothetical protein